MNINTDNLDTVIQSYVLGRLNDEQASEFEEYYLSKPDVIEQVEAVQYLHAGLHQIELSGEYKQTNSKVFKPNRAGESLYEKLLALISIPVPAFAVVALVAIMSPLMLQNINHQDQSTDIALINFSTQTTRSNDQGITIDLSNVKTKSAILIKLKTVDYPNYILKLSAVNQSEAGWESPSFQVSALRDKLISLPKLNSFGKVNVEVYGMDNNSNMTKVDFCHYSEVCK